LACNAGTAVAGAIEGVSGDRGAGSIGPAGTFRRPCLGGRLMGGGQSGLTPLPAMRVHDPSGAVGVDGIWAR
jgi:hypothetical protein